MNIVKHVKNWEIQMIIKNVLHACLNIDMIIIIFLIYTQKIAFLKGILMI